MHGGGVLTCRRTFGRFGWLLMGSRGFPKTTHLHVATGAPDKRQRGDFSPKPAAAFLPTEPDWHALLRNKRQEQDAHAEWELTVSELFRTGVLTRTDASTAVDYCICHARVLDCERRLSNKYTVRGANGTVKNPVSQLLTIWGARLQKHRDSLGLSPMARLRLGLAKETPPDDDSDLDDAPPV